MKRCLYFLVCMVLFVGSAQSGHSQIISTFAGNGLAGYSGDGGDALSARLDTPTSIAIDLSGNVFINDQRNNCVRRVSPSGIITTVAGTGSPGFSGDGGPATNARLDANWGMTIDNSGNIYICDQSNHRIRKVNSSGIISTIAGTGTPGYSGDGGPATSANINSPMGIAVDKTGNIYFSDSYNFCVRKISTTGTISTFAGIPGLVGFSGDGGPATSARIMFVWGIACDTSGNVYLCDGPNDRVRKVDAGGIITTFVGIGTTGYSGDNGPATNARLNKPLGVSVAHDGSVYIADCNNNAIRRVVPAGTITTVAGTGDGGYNGDGIPATAAKLHHPIGVVANDNDDVFITDMLNVRGRKVINVLSFIKGDEALLSVCQDAISVPINSLLQVRDVYVGLTDTWSLLLPAAHGTVIAGYSATSTGGIITPTGLTYTPDAGFVGIDSFKVKVANSLASDVITIRVVVDPLLVPGTISGSNKICLGDTALLISGQTGGAWSKTGALLELQPSLSTCIIKGIAVGVDTVRYTLTNACGSIAAEKIITVNPLPYPGTISGPSALCQGATVSFTASISDGTWSASNLNVSVYSTSPTTCDVTGVNAGGVTIAYGVSGTQCTAFVIKNIVVETFPVAGNITGPDHVCVGQQITLTDTIENGIWSADTGRISVTNGIVQGIQIGPDILKYSVTNSCGTDVTSRIITVEPLPETPELLLKRGIFYATKGYSKYRWILNGQFIPGATSDSLDARESGVYQVIVRNEYDCEAGSVLYDHTGCDESEISLFPNPTTNEVNVDWCRRVDIRAIAADGRVVATAFDTTVMSLSGLAPGVYIIGIYEVGGKRLRAEKITKLSN